MAVVVASLFGADSAKAQAQPDASLTAQQIQQAQVQSIEASKFAVDQMHAQAQLERLRLTRAAQEDAHAILSLYIQAIEGVIVFFLTMAMTSAGVYMSYLQFRKGFAQFLPDKPASEAPPPARGPFDAQDQSDRR
jgi:hypothetical protein